MANEQRQSSEPWTLETVPFIILILIASHILALVYWIYRLATQKQPPRRKAH